MWRRPIRSTAPRLPELGVTGDGQLIDRLRPLARAAGVLDRISVVYIEGDVRRDAHIGAALDTVYEIGSITKTMTSALFADVVESGLVRTDARLGSLLELGSSPAACTTLEELASHRSGLPRIASGLRDRTSAVIAVLRHRNPYTVDLSRLLARAEAAKIVARGQFSYSNLGAALLGQALAARVGVGYPDLLDRQLFTRLGMTRSTTPLTSADLPSEAPYGWSAHGRAEQPWTLGAYAPAGGVRSTPADMTHYVHALLDSTAPGLAALEPRWKTHGQSRIGYAWFTDQIDGSEVTWHNGTTGGFSSMLALDRKRAAAVIVLANTAVAVDTVALRLLLEDL